jgi:hypothetical protein
MTDSDILLITSMKKFIVIFSHTSNWDAVFILLYRLYALPSYKQMYILIKPQLYDLCPLIFKYIGCIRATKKEESGHGVVSTIVTFLKDKSNYMFLISPEGTRNASKWSTGYKYIVSQLDVPIVIAGMDYEQKRLKISVHVDVMDNEQILTDTMKQIVPLYPECQYCGVRDYNRHDVGIIDWIVLTSLMSGIYISLNLLDTHIWVSLCSLAACITSTMYHYSYEQKYAILDAYIARLTTMSKLISYFYDLILTCGINREMGICVEIYARIDVRDFGAYILISYILYEMSRNNFGLKVTNRGRERNYYRSKAYVRYHSLFHLSLIPFMLFKHREIIQ